MRPIPLSDDEMDAVYSACAPIAPDRRGGFLQALAAELRDKPIGPGSVHRAIVVVQRAYFDPTVGDRAGHAAGEWRQVCLMAEIRETVRECERPLSLTSPYLARPCHAVPRQA
jgi:hypothetical protein